MLIKEHFMMSGSESFETGIIIYSDLLYRTERKAMKKITLIFALAVTAAALTACGGKKTESTQTEAAQEQSAEADAQSAPSGNYSEAKLPEEYEPEYYEGTITDYTGSYMTINGENGEMMFDLNSVDMSDQTEPFVRGCSVEITYADAAENGTYPAAEISLLNDNEQLAQEEDRDPVIYGKLQVMDVNELEIVDDAGRTVDFDNSISRTVSFSDLQAGDNVVVTYAGTVYKDAEETDDSEDSTGIFDDVPVAIKIVAEDALKTEDAEANYIDGTVSGINGTDLTLSTELSDFDFSADESMLSGVEEEKHVRVYYTGALSDIVITAEKIEQLD